MSTSNFLVRNAKNIYSVEIFDDESIEYLQDEAECLGYDMDSVEIDEHIYNRSYYGRAILENKEPSHIRVNPTISIPIDYHIVFRGGYYCSANLDYDIFSGSNYLSDYNDIDSFAEHLAEEYDLKLEIDIEIIKVSLNKLVNNLERKCKKLCTEELKVVGTFSNGEAVYETC